MQQTLKFPLTRALCVLAVAWICTACDAPPADAAEAEASAQARRAAQLQLDELHLRMAAMRDRLQHVAPQQREALERELDALDALWRQTQRALVASGLAPSLHPPQEPAPWKKSG